MVEKYHRVSGKQHPASGDVMVQKAVEKRKEIDVTRTTAMGHSAAWTTKKGIWTRWGCTVLTVLTFTSPIGIIRWFHTNNDPNLGLSKGHNSMCTSRSGPLNCSDPVTSSSINGLLTLLGPCPSTILQPAARVRSVHLQHFCRRLKLDRLFCIFCRIRSASKTI